LAVLAPELVGILHAVGVPLQVGLVVYQRVLLPGSLDAMNLVVRHSFLQQIAAAARRCGRLPFAAIITITPKATILDIGPVKRRGFAATGRRGGRSGQNCPAPAARGLQSKEESFSTPQTDNILLTML